MTRADTTHVLVVEDAPVDRSPVADRLAAQAGVRLDVAASLAEALERVASTSHDCAVVDLSLADSAGVAAVEQLRVAAPMLPLIGIAATPDEQLALRALQLGAQDVLGRQEVEAQTLSRALRFAIERQRAAVHLAELAMRDPLTGVANRRLFADRLELAVARRARTGRTLAVMFADLDDFKDVNDSHGHDVGDDLLRDLAGRLQAAVREVDTVARLGGDEFTVLCEDLDSSADARGIGQRVLRAVEAPFVLGSATVSITMSLGIACADREGPTPAELLRLADLAMYRAKGDGTGLALAGADVR
jgi:diguanylate cyclase (GGDEF)-like protein